MRSLLLLLIGCGKLTSGQDILTPDTAELCGAWSPAAEALEEGMLEAVNEARAEGGRCGDDDFGPADPLSLSVELRCAARLHSQDMAEREFFDHVNPDGDDPGDRATAAGYTWTSVGENILEGVGWYNDVESGLAAWMESPGHCANIRDGAYTETGLGVWKQGEAIKWTQVFGDR
ncbi:MAG: CAP domain-containing protein [Alphaproteobacteria bacterium]|nr:CAP domain-containing protein [Alphaproteobacteria bacterium]